MDERTRMWVMVGISAVVLLGVAAAADAAALQAVVPGISFNLSDTSVNLLDPANSAVVSAAVSSSSLICFETPGWDVCSFSAAAVMLSPVWATAAR